VEFTLLPPAEKHRILEIIYLGSPYGVDKIQSSSEARKQPSGALCRLRTGSGRRLVKKKIANLSEATSYI